MHRQVAGAGVSGRRDVIDVALAAGRHLAAVAAGLLTVPLVAHHLGAEGLGAWAILGTTAFMLGAADLGLGLAAQRAWLADDRERTAEALAGGLTLAITLGPALALAGWFATDAIADGPHAVDLPLATAIALVGGVAGAYAQPLRCLLVAAADMAALARIRIATSAVQVLGTAIGLAFAPRLTTVACALAASLLVEAVALAVRVRRLGAALPLRPRVSALLPALRYVREGGAGLAINLGGLVATRADVWVLATLVVGPEPLAAVAAYGVAARLVDQSYTVAKQTSAALLPRLRSNAEGAATLVRGTAIMGALVGGGMIALVAFGGSWIRAWAGEAGARPETQLTLWLLASAAVILALHEVAAASLTVAAASPWQAAGPIVAGHALNLVVTLAGAPRFGLMAVAGGHVLGAALTAAMIWPRVLRLHRWGLRDLLLLLRAPVASLAAAAATALSLPAEGLLQCAGGAIATVAAGVVAATVACTSVAAEPSSVRG